MNTTQTHTNTTKDSMTDMGCVVVVDLITVDSVVLVSETGLFTSDHPNNISPVSHSLVVRVNSMKTNSSG